MKRRGITLNRAERKRQAKGHVITGWIKQAAPKHLKIGSGWFAELDRVYRKENGQYVVMMRDIQTEWGTVTHMTITAHQQPTWNEKQQIKNEIVGEEAVAVEVFPKESELVDKADMYHLWVLPIDLPFNLHEGEEQ